jgi:hypothetical protein
MYNGVKAMIAAEKELAAGEGGKPVKAGPHLKSVDDITGMVEFPADCKSSVARFMTKEVFEKYKDMKDKVGGTFKQCIMSGC